MIIKNCRVISPGLDLDRATVEIEDGQIKRVLGPENQPLPAEYAATPTHDADGALLMPGFIDAHVHVESSMLVPSEFARLAVVHGTVGTVSDPHEIANVCGIAGVDFMIENGKKVPFKFNFVDTFKKLFRTC